jgi:cell division protein FtsW
MTLLLLFIAKAKFVHIFFAGLFGSLAGSVILLMNPYMLARFNFLKPCENDGYQLCYSLMAIGSGGIFGKGLGASTSKLFFLPAAHTDFIFAVLAEELGIFGIVLIIALFYLFIRKCFSIGDRAIRVDLIFQGYLAYGIGIFITMQVLLSMAVNLGMAPTKGLALPLFSYGGSNYLVSILSITIVFRIYRDVYKKSINSSIR